MPTLLEPIVTPHRVADSNDQPIIEVRDLDVHYGSHSVLKEITCSFARNRVTAIMGPSGCGKSTLIKAINRSLELSSNGRVTRGSIRYRGVSLYESRIDPRSIRQTIGIIHQRPIPFPLSIEENVCFAPRFFHGLKRSERRDCAEKYLRMVGLWDEVKDRLGRSAEALSGGQQQRLCLARTLANQPDVILMDEPCSALDPSGSKRIEELMLTLKSDYTLIVVTHNMGQAKRVSDNAFFLYEGNLVEGGPTTEVFDNPQTELARDYVSGRFG